MIVADVAIGPVSEARSLGSHQFAALPRNGDTLLLCDADGEFVSVTVQAVYHYPKRVDGLGPSGEPGLTISTIENRF